MCQELWNQIGWRLNSDNYGVLAKVIGTVVREEQVGCPLENHGYLSDTAPQTLTRTQVERNPGPSPGIDVQTDGGEGFRGRVSRNTVFFQVAKYLLPTLPPASKLPSC